LEIGCGKRSYFHSQERKYTIIGFDIFEPSLIEAKNCGYIDKYIVGNVIEIEKYFKNKSYDTVVAFDLIEHLPKNEGYALIRKMQNIAKKRIIIFTPNGFVPQPPSIENPFQEHKSGWTYVEMKKLGFKVIGMNGLKYLRGMYALPKIKPKQIGLIISNITQIIIDVFKLNRLSYAIFCYKDV
jgi:2-polyprenyl-3-methyl-5-hydroxy-6-metoxy-1,4-benzoquinol methylase